MVCVNSFGVAEAYPSSGSEHDRSNFKDEIIHPGFTIESYAQELERLMELGKLSPEQVCAKLNRAFEASSSEELEDIIATEHLAEKAGDLEIAA